jgi:hypothetical protein
MNAQVLRVNISRIHEYLQANPTRFTNFEAPLTDYISITVKNVGSLAGDDVVLAYTTPPPVPAETGAPIQTLFGFERVTLQPGQSITLQFALSLHDLTFVGPSGKRQPSLGRWHLRFGQSEPVVVAVDVHE